MKHFFVIGAQASKSLSPIIFNHWFKKYKILAKYTFVEVQKKNFDKVLLKKIHENKSHGFNVTIPFKKKIIKHLDIKSKHAQNIGAVNCVTIDNKIKGTNTDWIGYLNSIENLKVKKNKNILILGYGGASQAIVYGFLIKGFKNILVFNRSKKLIKFTGVKSYTKKYSLINNYLINADLIINTTPINPLSSKQTKLVQSKTIISDIVYKPKNTNFLKTFRENQKIYGISMLLEQAIPSFSVWFGFEPKIDEGLINKLNLKIK